MATPMPMQSTKTRSALADTATADMGPAPAQPSGIPITKSMSKLSASLGGVNKGKGKQSQVMAEGIKKAKIAQTRATHGGFRSAEAQAHGYNQLDKLGGANMPGAGQHQPGLGEAKVDTSLAPKVEKRDDHHHGPGAPLVNVPMVDRIPFNVVSAIITLVNVIIIGLEQDLGPPTSSPMSERLNWYMMEVGFCCAFIAELIIRFLSKRREFLNDLWNVLDCILVFCTTIEAFVLSPLGMGGQIRLFTVLRALRIVRIVRLVRMFAAFRELWLLVGGVTNSLKALGWVGVIVIIVLYVCAIVVTAEIGQNHDTYAIGPSYDGEVWPYEKYFGTVMRSMFTLFQVVTMDGWCDDIVRHVVYRQPFMGVFFVLFLVMTAFGLINVVVGIIVENTLAAAQVADRRVEERQAFLRRDAVEKLHDILDKSDVMRTGEISFEELRSSYESHIVKDKFDQIGLTLEEVQEIFTLLDHDQRGRVELDRFAASCRELVGGAKRRDLAQIEVTVGSLAQHLGSFEGQIGRIEMEVASLADMAEDFMQNTVRILTGFDGSSKPPVRRDTSMSGGTMASTAS